MVERERRPQPLAIRLLDEWDVPPAGCTEPTLRADTRPAHQTGGRVNEIDQRMTPVARHRKLSPHQAFVRVVASHLMLLRQPHAMAPVLTAHDSGSNRVVHNPSDPS